MLTLRNTVCLYVFANSLKTSFIAVHSSAHSASKCTTTIRLGNKKCNIILNFSGKNAIRNITTKQHQMKHRIIIKQTELIY